MTQKEFIRKFKQICQKNCITDISTKNWTYGVQMCYTNYQDDEIVNEFVEIIGFDEYDEFYIGFCDDCTAFEEDLECNREDAWDLLYRAILDDIFGLDSTDDEHDFKAGDAVYWNDPAIDDYPDDEREEALKRRFVIFGISGEIIRISDTYTTAEVYASELEHIS